ncbi:hypothetical protein [Candidatus Magnetominusculus xianensis]|uniref:Transposase n=1 Tax=Candidatus Magnetominusculus xianensis TaxID=1748249 RepID=A0ABR5SI23_9BACT|nr:hypothetical protein [Candidatus Magnetominusculus xianensis]KWT91890.1 putative transposase [Candidatus Magnetominusculus xianensis]MBF0404082.1 hypothetical protein [Nitrospirota bacterium]
MDRLDTSGTVEAFKVHSEQQSIFNLTVGTCPQPCIQNIKAESHTTIIGLGGSIRKSDDTEGLAIDGKTVKGAHLLSAFFHHEGITIALSTGGGEIPGVKQLLKDVDISGMTVTADALHTQRKTAEFLVKEKEAHYFFTVKDNQSTLKQKHFRGRLFPPQHKTDEDLILH